MAYHCRHFVMDRDIAILAQLEGIRDVQREQPLIGAKQATADLLREYEDEVFCAKIQTLNATHAQMRRARGDGNCFYRAFAYRLLESADAVEAQRLKDQAVEALEQVVACGYSRFTAEDFHETYVDLLDEIIAAGNVPDSTLAQVAGDEMVSNYIVTYFRMITSMWIKTHEDEYAPFIEGGASISQFCGKEVDPMNVESSHLQIRAVTEAFKVGVHLAYLDRTPGAEPTIHAMADVHGDCRIHLLYRPGHYDVLYQGSAP